MPTVQQILERINNEVAERAVSEALTHYMKDNMDLFEDFAEGIIEIIKSSPVHMETMARAVVENYVRALENGETELMDIEAFDTINAKLSERISEILKDGIGSLL